jgi:hypothetical protein
MTQNIRRPDHIKEMEEIVMTVVDLFIRELDIHGNTQFPEMPGCLHHLECIAPFH